MVNHHPQESSYGNFGIKVTKSYTDFSTAGTSNAIEAFSLPAGCVLLKAKIKHSTSFRGGAIGSYTIALGLAGNTTKYMAGFNVFQNVANTTLQFTLDSTSSLPDGPDQGSATSIKATAQSTGANLNAATQGAVDIWLLVASTL